jgi:hypothetical protein
MAPEGGAGRNQTYFQFEYNCYNCHPIVRVYNRFNRWRGAECGSKSLKRILLRCTAAGYLRVDKLCRPLSDQSAAGRLSQPSQSLRQDGYHTRDRGSLPQEASKGAATSAH